MKALFIFTVLMVCGVMKNNFAQQAGDLQTKISTASDVRSELAKVLPQHYKMPSKDACITEVADYINGLQLTLDEAERELNDLSEPNNRNIKRSFEVIKSARSILPWYMIECKNQAPFGAKRLMEMYFSHLDNELMEYVVLKKNSLNR